MFCRDGCFIHLLLLFVQVVSDISCFVEMGVLSIHFLVVCPGCE